MTQLPLIPREPVYSIKIIIPGEPVPKGRHRSRIVYPRHKAAFIHNYPDPQTEKYESMIAKEAAIVMAGKGLITGALSIVVMAWVLVPQSWSIKKQVKAIEGEIIPVTRPDADNYLKCCLDAMNGIVYKDDAQFVDMRVSKRYSDNPRLEIEIFAV